MPKYITNPAVRRPPRCLVTASAVLLVTVLVLWARSYWRIDSVSQGHGRGPLAKGEVLLSVQNELGHVVFVRTTTGFDWVEARGRAYHSAKALSANTYQHGYDGSARRFRLGPVRGYAPWRDDDDLRFECLDFPHWLVAVVAGLPVAWAVLARRTLPPGHCRRCGYDLTGNESGRCPECGTAPG